MGSARARAGQYVRRVNQAMELLTEGVPPAEPARRLADQYNVSERQAWRYLQEVAGRSEPLEVPEPKVVFTVKLPQNLVERVRSVATSRGRTLGSLVADALEGLLQRLGTGQADGGREPEG